MEQLESDSARLHGTISFTCTIAENVSGRVRELDVAQSNVQTALKRVEDIIDLKVGGRTRRACHG